MKYPSVLCMGGCVIDRVGETLDVHERLHTSNIGRMRTSLGGVARNVAENLARLSVGSALISLVGADSEGQRLVAGSRAAGVDMDLVQTLDEAATASYTAIFNGEGELIIGLADMGIFDRMAPGFVRQALACGHDDALLFMDANLPVPVLEAIAAGKRGRRLAAVPVSQQKLPRLLPVLDKIDVLFLNRYEAATLLGASPENEQALARGLAASPVRQGLLTLGPAGALAWDNGVITPIPALPSCPVNVNGAGDSLAAATLARLAAGDDFALAAARAMAAAALTVESQETVRADLSMAGLLSRFALSNPEKTIS